MTIQECYQQMGGNFSEVQNRLPSVRLIEKFVARFPDDESYSQLFAAMEEGDREKAFRGAHTLKGVCANLSLSKLLLSVSLLTELLRPEADAIPFEAFQLFEDVKQDYALTVSTIRAFLDGQNK